MASPTIHASAVLVGRHALLIRGPSGSGKSRLALGLIQAAEQGLLRFARLVADDRCHLEAVNFRLLFRPSEVLAGMSRQGFQPAPLTADAFDALIRAEMVRLQSIVKDVNIRLD